MDSLPNGLTTKYSIERQLGIGASGVVYLVRHLRTQRLEAMKVFRRDETAPNATYRFARERFRLEAQLAAKVRHPNLLQVFDYDEIEDVLYITMEYAAAGSLADALRVGGPIPIDAVVRIVREAALGLQALHDADVIHRDVKPSNLLLVEDGRLVVADLGLAQVRGGQMSERVEFGSTAAMHPGTPDYMSPEHGRPQSLLPTSDVYSLGCTAFELLSGRVWVREQARVDRVSHLRRDVPPWLDDVVFRMLLEAPGMRASDASDPTKRYVSMTAVVSALDTGAAAPKPVRRMPVAPPPAIVVPAVAPTASVRPDLEPGRNDLEAPPSFREQQLPVDAPSRSQRGLLMAAVGAIVLVPLAVLFTAVLTRLQFDPAAAATARATPTVIVRDVATAEPRPTYAPTDGWTALAPTDDSYVSIDTALIETPTETPTEMPTETPTETPTDVPAPAEVPTEPPPAAVASDVVCDGSGWFFPRHPNEPLQNVRLQPLMYQKAEGAIFIKVDAAVFMLASNGGLHRGDSVEALQAQYGVGVLSGEKVSYSRLVGNTVSGNRVTAYVPLPDGTIMTWWYVDGQPSGWKELKTKYSC